MSVFWLGVLQSVVKGYGYFLAYVSVLMIAELAFPRGKLMSIEARLRALLFGAVFIPAVVLSGRAVALFRPEPFFEATLVATIASMFAYDFFYYWFHRAQHSIPLLWRLHAVHHSVEELGAGGGYHHILEAPFKALLVGIPTGFLFVRGDVGLFVAFILGMKGYYLHSTTRLNFGPLAWVIADNRVHRIHHSLEPKHFNRNFGSFTLLWDKLFGTAYFPARNEWPAIGLEGYAEPKTVSQYLLQPFLPLPEKIDRSARDVGRAGLKEANSVNRAG